MTAQTMRALRFHAYGEPADVLILEEAAVPVPGPGHVAVEVHVCGLNPADWALCRGLQAGGLPRGVGLDVSGTVIAVGDGVTGVALGDAVYGPAEFRHYPSAGAADVAVLNHWERLPSGLSHVDAAALPMVVETAARYLTWSGAKAGQSLLVHGAGTMVGFALVQMALLQGVRVIATAGDTFAEKLREFGAVVTGHGDGMVGRVRELMDQPLDAVIDSAPANLASASSSALPDLIELADGDAKRVITIADFEGAAKTGARTGAENVEAEGGFRLRWDVLGAYGKLAAEGKFCVPVARTFGLGEWREALGVSVAGKARGKLVLSIRQD
ncbi:NADP-dependent oxidoreductase [Bacillus sp. NP157]|nr:NADP-dependent oxidoreductase [Bacillus sp. NP157]